MSSKSKKRKKPAINDDDGAAAPAAQGPSKRQQQLLGRQDSSYRRRYDVLESALSLSDKKLPYEILELITEQADPCGGLTAFDCFTGSKDIKDPFADAKSGGGGGGESQLINCSQWCWENCHEFLEYFLEELPLNILQEAKINPVTIPYFMVGMHGPGMVISRSTRGSYHFEGEDLDFNTDNIQAICAELPENFSMFIYNVNFMLPPGLQSSLPSPQIFSFSRDVLYLIKSKYPQFKWNAELYKTQDGYLLNLNGHVID